jgi:hypothetical protein
MRYPGTRPLVRRMQAIDQALRARKWPADKTPAKNLEVDPRTIRRDLEFMRDERHAPIAFEGAITKRSRRIACRCFRRARASCSPFFQGSALFSSSACR